MKRLSDLPSNELYGYTEIDPASLQCLVSFCENPVQAGQPISCVEDNHQLQQLGELLQITSDHFFICAKGDSMIDADIHSGDLLVVRRADAAEEGQIVIAEVDNACTVKRFHLDPATHQPILLPCNARYSPIHITPHQSFTIFGIVQQAIKHFN